MNFNVLCAELGINETRSTAENLSLLRQWFRKNLSTDLNYSGSESQQYELYQTITTAYLDEIHPLFTSNNSNDEENLIFTLASLGLDQALLTLNPKRALLAKVNSYGFTPLHLATMQGRVNTTKVLLSLGADTLAPNQQQQYPIFSSLMLPIKCSPEIKRNKIAIFKLLEKKGTQSLTHQDRSGNTILHQIAMQPHLEELIRDLLKTHPTLANIKNKEGHYPIHTAILHNQLENIRALIAAEEKNASLVDNEGRGTLHYAAEFGDSDIIEACCLSKTKVDALDKKNRTPLMLAAQNGQLQAVKILIDMGAQVNVKDTDGLSVLHYAALSDNIEITNWLLQKKQFMSEQSDLFETSAYVFL